MMRWNAFFGLTGAALLVAAAGCQQSVAHQDMRKLATLAMHKALVFPDNPAIRAQATEAASEVLGPGAPLLIRDRLTDSEPGVRFAALMALGQLRHKPSRDLVRPLTTDPDSSVRVGAFFALERMGEKGYRKYWADLLLKHEDPAVRRNAAMALGQLEDRGVIPLLQRSVADDNDEGVRLQATEALAYLGDEASTARFLHDAYGGMGYRQPFALLTLAKVNDRRVVPTMLRCLSVSPYIEARLAAARGLGMHRNGEGYTLAMESLNWNQPSRELADDTPETQIMRVRSMAAMALGAIGDPEALPALRERLEKDADPRVQLAAATAILQILEG